MSTEENETIKTCAKCKKPLEFCRCEGDKKIVIEHRFPTKSKGKSKNEGNEGTNLSEEELKDKLQERESQLATLALREFDQKKAEFLSKFPESRREQLSKWIETDPDRLELIRGSLIASGQIEEEDLDGTSKVPPSGVAGLPPKGGARRIGHRNPNIQFISDLYNTQLSPTASAEEKAEADRALESFFEQLELGLQARPRRGKYRDYSIQSVTHCPKCGNVISGVSATLFAKGKSACPTCNYDHKRPIKNPYLQPK